MQSSTLSARPRARTHRHLFAGLLAVVVVAAGCGGGGGPEGQVVRVTAPSVPSTRQVGLIPVSPGFSLVAQALGPKIQVFSAAGGAAARTLSNPNENGAPLVFLVENQVPGWAQVDLPVRPNGSTGWIRAADAKFTQIDYKIKVELGAFHITVYKGGKVILSEPVGLGTGTTPTPGGKYYIKELLKPPNPNGAYGPYAYGLSGFSNVLTSFAGGNGVVGIHGTNDPAAIGHSVSHGCIRMSNSGITTLAKMLPLGTPVEIDT